ncbi:hypothetical protein PVAP13_5KG386128 [Panicum virgatum]|uniref:Uncharacterized protein n=1 Tax=Panicum virgatum TaxID=38727 RepID=A0A8T0SP95_PANVG|nr:hypothetical protein PVAP13_5KG386128 [Panicum virgatum]
MASRFLPPPLAVSLVVHDPRPATAGLPHRRLLPLPSRSPHSAFLSTDPRRRGPERRFPRPRGGAPVRAAVLQVCATRRALRHFHAGCSPTRPSRLAAPAHHQHQLLPRQAGRRLTPGGRLMECRTGAWSASPTRLSLFARMVAGRRGTQRVCACGGAKAWTAVLGQVEFTRQVRGDVLNLLQDFA